MSPSGWMKVPGRDLAEHQGRIISIYRSTIPTRIIDVSAPNMDGQIRLTIEWTEPTSAAGGLIRHDAGRREVIVVHADDEQTVFVDAESKGKQ